MEYAVPAVDHDQNQRFYYSHTLKVVFRFITLEFESTNPLHAIKALSTCHTYPMTAHSDSSVRTALSYMQLFEIPEVYDCVSGCE